eukprot:Amastigsp_a16650_4.p2 type:complete len:167 gc:universal Amastigsp_a16650_4:526-26(-)
MTPWRLLPWRPRTQRWISRADPAAATRRGGVAALCQRRRLAEGAGQLCASGRDSQRGRWQLCASGGDSQRCRGRFVRLRASGGDSRRRACIFHRQWRRRPCALLPAALDKRGARQVDAFGDARVLRRARVATHHAVSHERSGRDVVPHWMDATMSPRPQAQVNRAV